MLVRQRLQLQQLRLGLQGGERIVHGEMDGVRTFPGEIQPPDPGELACRRRRFRVEVDLEVVRRPGLLGQQSGEEERPVGAGEQTAEQLGHRPRGVG